MSPKSSCHKDNARAPMAPAWVSPAVTAAAAPGPAAASFSAYAAPCRVENCFRGSQYSCSTWCSTGKEVRRFLYLVWKKRLSPLPSLKWWFLLDSIADITPHQLFFTMISPHNIHLFTFHFVLQYFSHIICLSSYFPFTLFPFVKLSPKWHCMRHCDLVQPQS
jgi:hypothetical protein